MKWVFLIPLNLKVCYCSVTLTLYLVHKFPKRFLFSSFVLRRKELFLSGSLIRSIIIGLLWIWCVISWEALSAGSEFVPFCHPAENLASFLSLRSQPGFRISQLCAIGTSSHGCKSEQHWAGTPLTFVWVIVTSLRRTLFLHFLFGGDNVVFQMKSWRILFMIAVFHLPKNINQHIYP